MPTTTATKQKKQEQDTKKTLQKDDIRLPFAKNTEQLVLGLLLKDQIFYAENNRVFERAIERGLNRDHFYLPSHRTIFGAMLDCKQNGLEIHPVTLADRLRAHHKLEEVGGVIYLTELMDAAAPAPTMLGGLIDQLKTLEIKRRTLRQADKLVKMASNGASLGDIQEIIDSFENTQTQVNLYAATPSGLVFRKPGRNFGVEPEKLTNFVARIVQEEIHDDGSQEEQRYFQVECLLGEETRRIKVPASKFDSMAWPTASLGAKAIIYPGQSGKAKVAIQALSHHVIQTTIYTHTGWRTIDGKASYLHGGGAITAEGNRTDVAVTLPESLRFFFLPDPPTDDNISAAFNAVMELKSAFPKHITIPLLGSIFGAVLGGINYSPFLVGTSGTFKSQLTAIGQSFWGAGFDADHFPASWNDSVTVIMYKLFVAKDAWLVIDDFVPIGQKQYDDQLHAKAEKVLRAAANRTAHGRATIDGSERSAKEPRAMAVSSGEDLPKGGSLQNRLAIYSLKKGDIDTANLTQMQTMAREGKFALSMSAFIQFVASDYESILAKFSQDRLSLRTQIQQQMTGAHTRQPTTLAHLAASWRVWLNACVARQVMNKEEAVKLWKEVWQTLAELIEGQKDQQTTINDADYFCQLLCSALLSGRCHLATVKGTQPDNGFRYGWRDGEPMGELVGWVSDGLIYLQPEAAYKNANMQGHSIGQGIAVTEKKLWERMDERGYLALKEKGRGFQARVPVIRAAAVVIAENRLFDDSDDLLEPL